MSDVAAYSDVTACSEVTRMSFCLDVARTRQLMSTALRRAPVQQSANFQSLAGRRSDRTTSQDAVAPISLERPPTTICLFYLGRTVKRELQNSLLRCQRERRGRGVVRLLLGQTSFTHAFKVSLSGLLRVPKSQRHGRDRAIRINC
jgi:hypothetical protein